MAESVFIAGMFVKYGEDYVQLSDLLGNAEEAQSARNEVKKVYDAVLDAGWDGDWFVRAYDAFGNKVGSKECEEGQIYIEPQGFCTLAETVVGHGNRAFEVYKKTCPAFLQDISEIHRTEPYVYSQMVAGADAVHHGEAKNSWLTGTAAWTFVNISQYILGIMPDWNGLKIDPCVPSDFGSYTVKRFYRSAEYEIHIDNPNQVEKGVVSITVDGKSVFGNVIPLETGKTYYNVHVVMG